MAVDKLVDSTQLDADLTSVANAIRTKGGTSASLAFPADFVSAIAAIPSGGGGSAKSGSFTPSANGATQIISDLAGTSLKNLLVRATPQLTSVTGKSVRAFAAGAINQNENIFFSLGTNSSGSSVNTQNSGTIGSGNVFTLNTTTGEITVSTGSNGGGYLVSGVTYDWWAW